MQTSGKEEAPSPNIHLSGTHSPLTALASGPVEFITNKEGESEADSLVIEFWQLIPQDYSMIHTSSCDSDQVDDTSTGAIPVHGQSDSCRGFQVRERRRQWLSFKKLFLPLLSTIC